MEQVTNNENMATENVLPENNEVKAPKVDKLTEFGQKLYNKMPSWMQKAVSFVSREWLYFAIPVLIFALFMGVLYSMNIYPFGHDNMSNYDMLAQIAPFYEHFYDVIDGKSGLFYSPAIAGGADVFGTLAYCAVSPFTFIFLFFGRTTVYNAISIVLPLKLSCVGISALYFLKKEFKNINEYVMLMVALLYAYCGYMFVANTYVNWVDFLIYMPFVIIGFKKLVTEKKIRYFGISYALMIYACFSIACFALFLIFIVFIAYVMIVCKKGERIEILAKMCYALALAVGLALPILVPSFFAYARSGRNTGLFENMGKELTADHLYSKMTYIFADAIFLGLTFIYFIKNKLKNRLDVFLLVAGIVLMMPVLIDEICNLMNAGSYMSYSLRFGFLNATYGFYISARLLSQLKEEKVNKKLNIGFGIIFAVICAFAVIFILNLNNTIVNADGSESDSIINFSGHFAHSTGGLEIIYQIALVIIASMVVGALLYTFKLVNLRTVSYILIALTCVQIAFYNIHLVRGNAFNPLRYDQFNAIVSTIDQYDDRRYYRIKDNSAAITNDSALNTHTNSFGVFSSVIDNDNFIVTNMFNYHGNQTNSIETSGGSFFSDCLLGYKYYFVHTDVNGAELEQSTHKRDYLVKLEDTQQANFCAYENTAVFPNCYTVDSGSLIMNSGDYCDDLQELYNFLGGKGSFYEEDSFRLKSKISADEIRNGYHNWIEVLESSETDEVLYKIQFKTDFVGQYYVDADFPEEFNVGYNSGVDANKFNLDYSEQLVDSLYYGYATNKSYYHLTLKNNGETPLTVEDVEKYVKLKVITNDKVLELSQYLKTRACDYTQTRNKFTIKATAENDETYVLLNYVSIEGFEATVNGKKAEVIDNGIKFLLVKLDKGENVVEFTYHSPYYKYILIGVVLGGIVILVLWLILKKFPSCQDMVNKIVCAMAVMLALGIFAFFYVYPTSLFAQKLVALLLA